MNQPSQEDLLGYVLGALDAQEHRDLQQCIDDNPELEEQLLSIKAALAPLDCLDTSGPRPGLARRTCEAVASWDPRDSEALERLAFLDQLPHLQHDSADVSATHRSVDVVGQDADDVATVASPNTSTVAGASSSPVAQPDLQPASRLRELRSFRNRSWSVSDVLVGVACLSIVCGLLFPAVAWQRQQSRIWACQNNLRQVGGAMLTYSSIHDGQFVAIPEKGNMSVAGCFGPILKDAGLIEDDSWLACAGVQDDTPVSIPSIGQIESAVSQSAIDYYRSIMGGHFGYSIGYCEGKRYKAPENVGNANLILLSDKPSSNRPGRVSSNHGGSGQNCLFADGRVKFIKGSAYGNDALFENDYGVVAPGSSQRDNVIAPSHLSPVIGIQMTLAPAE